MKIRYAAFLPILIIGVLCVGCGSTTPSNPGVAELSALAAQDAQTAADDGTTGPAAPLIDPCTALTKADVQPFFTAQLATALPALLGSDQERSCEFAPTNKTSSLIVDYLVGDAAQTKLMLNQQPGGDAVSVPGIGDGANYPAGDPTLLFSWKGSGSTTVVCTVTTTGSQFALRSDPSATLTTEQATGIDEQYGTLCNELYGSGNTTPTVPRVSVASADPLPSLTAPVPSDSGQTMPGSSIPLPAGMDCSGTRTTKDSLNGINCSAPVSDALAVYTFYLTALPAHGYSISSEQFWPAKDGVAAHANIMFTSQSDGLCFVDVLNGTLMVSKQVT